MASDFAPDADVQYSNTNYILLGEVISAVEGKPFYEVFDERIFQPLDLKHTQFASTDPVPEGIVRGYVDLYSNMNLINSTYYSGWDYHTADGGLISNAHDLNRFMDALFNHISSCFMNALFNNNNKITFMNSLFLINFTN